MGEYTISDAIIYRIIVELWWYAGWTFEELARLFKLESKVIEAIVRKRVTLNA